MKKIISMAIFAMAFISPFFNVSADPIDNLKAWYIVPNGPGYDWCGYNNTNIYSNGTLHAANIGIAQGNLVIDLDETERDWIPNVQRNMAQNVNIQTLSSPAIIDDFVRNNNLKFVNFIKIGQGNVLHSLVGADQLISNGQVDFIQFPYGSFYSKAGIKLQDVFNYLTEKGYAVYRISNLGFITMSQWRPALENNKTSYYLAVRIAPTKN